MHEVDTFTRLALLAGAEVPADRPIDGVDQRDFLLGNTAASAREAVPIFFGHDLFAVKWRNFKVFFVWLADPLDAAEKLSVPRVIDLITNPKEDPAYSLTTTYLWVIQRATRIVAELQASLHKYPEVAGSNPVPATCVPATCVPATCQPD